MGHFSLLSLGCLTIFLSLSGAEGYGCPNDWLPGDWRCYKVFNKPKNWLDAEMFCRKLKPGCHLASIHSKDDSADLADYLTDYLIGRSHVWIGLRDTNKNYNWEWTDRSKTDYLPWNENQPDHWKKNEFCVEILGHSGYLQWNDDDCGALRPFLCQCVY